MATPMHLLSLFLGSISSNAIRLSSIMPSHGVPSTSPRTWLRSMGGPKLITPWSLPSRNAPRWSWELFTCLPE